MLARRPGEHAGAVYSVPARFDQDSPTPWPLPEPEEVEFASRDPELAGKSLAGWWIPADAADPAAAPAVVLVHGIQSCRREANVLLPAAMLHRAGFSVFLMDLRDHGDSEGDDGRFAGGSEEYLDVLGGWDWVAAQGVPAERIGLLGLSFGSANADHRRGPGAPGAGGLGGLGAGPTWANRSGCSSPASSTTAAACRRCWCPARSSGRGSSPATT